MQVIESYTPRHVALFSPELAWSDDAFSGEFIAALRGGESALRALMREECPGVYSFPLLSAATCRAIVDEMKVTSRRQSLRPCVTPPTSMPHRTSPSMLLRHMLPSRAGV
jgi:hypothetical protein